MNSHAFLRKYLNAFAPVAQESEGQRIWLNYIANYVHRIDSDAYGTAWGIYKSDNPDAKRVVIEAHCDEIAWIITQIEKDGFVRLKRHGGSDNMIAPSKTVMIHTHGGKKVPAVFGWPAVHTREKYTQMGYDQHELWLDLGVESAEAVAALGVEVGCLVTFDDELHELGDYYVGRSLDNKIGGYIIAEAVKRLHNDAVQLPYDLYVVNSVQEEVGLYGAKMVAKRLQADLALVHDVCHNTNHPKMDKAKDGDVKGGQGPALEFTAQNHRMILKQLRQVAEQNDIPLQLHVGSYGNDTMAFFLENTPTAILATPLKYMHTTVEMAHKDDVQWAVKLFVEFLKSLTPEFIEAVNKPLEQSNI